MPWNDLLSGISWLAVIFIMLLITLRSILDVAKGMGFLPKKIYDGLYKSENERFRAILDEVGILPRISKYRALTNALDNPPKVSSQSESDLIDSLNKVSKKYIKKQELVVGDNSKMKIEYFLSLREAFLDGHDYNLSQIMASYISNISKENGIEYDCIVSRKSAFDILGYMVSKLLNVDFILYHDHKSIFGSRGNLQPFDFFPSEIKSPIILDDSCVGGSGIVEMAEAIRQHVGVTDVHAFVFFTRKKDVENSLQSHNVSLHYLKFFADKDLKKLYDARSG